MNQSQLRLNRGGVSPLNRSGSLRKSLGRRPQSDDQNTNSSTYLSDRRSSFFTLKSFAQSVNRSELEVSTEAVTTPTIVCHHPLENSQQIKPSLKYGSQQPMDSTKESYSKVYDTSDSRKPHLGRLQQIQSQTNSDHNSSTYLSDAGTSVIAKSLPRKLPISHAESISRKHEPPIKEVSNSALSLVANQSNSILSLHDESAVHAIHQEKQLTLPRNLSYRTTSEPSRPTSPKLEIISLKEPFETGTIKKKVIIIANSRRLIQCTTLIFLLPAFDGKGKIIDVELFDKEDVKNVSFLTNGIHPKSYFHTVWDLFVTCMSLVYLCYIPFLISFATYEESEIVTFSLALTTTFALDTCVALATPQPMEQNPLCSLREYEAMRPLLKEWILQWIGISLVFELIPIIPFHFIFSEWKYSSLLLLIRLLRFYRLPACMSRCGIISRTKYKLDKLCGFTISAIIPILIGMFIFLHFSACSLYYFGKMTGFVGWANAWTGINNAGVVELYSYSFFKAVGNMFPCAFPAQTAVEQLVASFYVIASAVLYAAFLGAISSATMSINPSGKLFTQKMDELSDYVKWKKLSPETTKKIFSYYETKYRGKYFEEDLLLLELNESLRKEISLQNTQALIERVPFLRRQMNDGRDEIFFARLATVLHANYFVKNDFIIKQGDYGFDMFFILSGMVNVIVNGKKVVSLYDGAYFGEVALLAKILRTSTVQATTPSVLYRLTYNDFHEVVNEFDDMKIRIQALTKEYEERLRNTASTEAAVNKLRKLDESDEAQKEQEDREMGETQ
ncbi:hypothetical protein BCR33DRAFT_713683 [Rhizoclosmatium globosum]|uniref:Cyclic nucleotide-binding domain-containing protein n=1 Tax=Rhizoclosmatium globosum TaxID=329046 RepID=A0A1Y2CR55_9FUNG|nr:hypothetical protein BCR33DRAFT_713683 [Rhizoclosmatium globosum]|eukprot:ORY49314.1 hypothetical protein BCR33DRAFT_713683 [Rhizoclosmatium globosum]